MTGDKIQPSVLVRCHSLCPRLFKHRTFCVAPSSLQQLSDNIQQAEECLHRAQISQLLPYIVLPHEGCSDEGMVSAITQVLITGKFFGDARCSAKMSILHYITLQPDLMLRETNLMLRLLKLVIKMQPDVNGQVSLCDCLLSSHVTSCNRWL
jgi:hypothetical protein